MIIDISQIGHCLKFRPCCPAIKHKGAQSNFSAFLADKILWARNKRQSNDMWEVEKEEVLLVDGFCRWMKGGRGAAVCILQFQKEPSLKSCS